MGKAARAGTLSDAEIRKLYSWNNEDSKLINN